MESIYEIIFHEDVLKIDIPSLSPVIKTRVMVAIEEKLERNPEVFGKPLRYSFKNHRTLRVGDYRVIFKIEGSGVKIFMIEHRSVIYDLIKKRIRVY